MRNTKIRLSVDKFQEVSGNALILSGNTTIDTNGNGIQIGTGTFCAIGANSVVFGENTCGAEGANSFAQGCQTLVCGANSVAFNNSTRACGANSIAFGSASQANGVTSLAGGTASIAICNHTIAVGAGARTASDYSIAIGGCNPIICTGSQFSGVLGGYCNTIESGNTCSAIIAGNSITLTADNYANSVAVNNLAIFSNPSGGTSNDDVLVWNNTTKKVNSVTQNTLTPSVSNGLSINGSNIVLGGTLTGDTVVDTGGFGIVFGDGTATGTDSFSEGHNASALGTYSHAEGNGTWACGDISHAEGMFSCALNTAAHAEGCCNIASGRTSHAEGKCSVAYGYISHAEGCCARSIGDISHAEGRFTCAIGTGSHAEGMFSHACGVYSHAEGMCPHAIGIRSHAEGFKTCSVGAHSHSENFCTHACGCSSHSEGTRTIADGYSSHAGGFSNVVTKEVLASGIASFNHSENDGQQVAGSGALAPRSVILGGCNHNIESGNTGAAIIGGDKIKLTGTSYIDTTAVDKLALITIPTSGSSDQVLVRNTSTGKVDYVSKASLGGSTTAANGLSICGDNVVLGGTLTGDTLVDTDSNGIAFGGTGGICGSSNASGNDSFVAGGTGSQSSGSWSLAGGYGNIASGNGSFAMGIYACTSGDWSMGFGNNVCTFSDNSIAVGECVVVNNTNTQGFGVNVHACGYSSHASGFGISTKEILTKGVGSFNHSTNDAAQTVAHGALANNSAILGGKNHNIEVGNTRATIIGGNAIKLTGTTYIDTTAVDKLALMSVPTSGSSDQVLVRNTSTGLVDYVSKASLNTCVRNGVSIDSGGYVVLGGTLSSDTCINTNSFGIVIGNSSYAEGANSVGGGYCSYACGDNSITFGYYACSIGNHSAAFGNGAKTFGTASFAAGAYAYACGNCSVALGTAQAIGLRSFAAQSTKAYGNNSVSFGLCGRANGCTSFVGGRGGTSKCITADGNTSFIFSENTAAQIGGHGALAANSAILGGINHNIESGNTGATIIGGSTIKLTGTTYINTTAVANLAVISTPSNNTTTDQVLVRNTSTGVVDYVSKASLGGGAAANGLSIGTGGEVVLGGTLTGDTCIGMSTFGIAFGGGSIAIGHTSFAFGCNAQATGDYGATAFGYDACAVGDCSFAANSGKACGLASFAVGNSTTAYGENSHTEGSNTCAIGQQAHAEGTITHACGDWSHSGGKGIIGSKQLIAGGNSSFIHSTNTAAQTIGHGALAVNSVILGGQDHNIEVGNTGATIIGGNTIKLTGTTYIDTTAVANLAVVNSPINNTTTDQVLVRNTSTGRVDYVSKASIAGGGADYLRADITDNKTSGHLIFNDDIRANFGTGSDMCISYVSGDNSSGIYVNNSNACFVLQGGANIGLLLNPDNQLELYHGGSVKQCTASFGTCTIGTNCTTNLVKAPIFCATTAFRTSHTGFTACLTTGCGCAVDWAATSDCRCKNCIEPYECGLDKINQLKPVSYEWKHDNTEDIGFIAQDVIEVEPKLVVGSEEDGYALKYDKFAAISIKAIQELSDKVKELEDKLNNK